MSGATVQGTRQWQTARVVAEEDELLTDYKPADLTAAVLAKGIRVKPATAIMVRAIGKDTDGDTAVLHVTGFMDPSKLNCGPGQRLWIGTITLGARSIATFIPLNDGKWGAAATWFEADTWASTTDSAGATEIVTTDQESCLLLPTLGYDFLLFEVRDIGGVGEMTEIGFIWRPIAYERVIRTF